MTFIRSLIAFLFVLAGFFAGFFVGIEYFAIPGVENMASGFKADPADGGLMVWGFVQFWFLSWIIGGIVALVCWGIAALFVPDTNRQRRNEALFRRQLGWSPSAHQVERDWNEIVRGASELPDDPGFDAMVDKAVDAFNDQGPRSNRSVF